MVVRVAGVWSSCTRVRHRCRGSEGMGIRSFRLGDGVASAQAVSSSAKQVVRNDRSTLWWSKKPDWEMLGRIGTSPIVWRGSRSAKCSMEDEAGCEGGSKDGGRRAMRHVYCGRVDWRRPSSISSGSRSPLPRGPWRSGMARLSWRCPRISSRTVQGRSCRSLPGGMYR